MKKMLPFLKKAHTPASLTKELTDMLYNPLFLSKTPSNTFADDLREKFGLQIDTIMHYIYHDTPVVARPIEYANNPITQADIDLCRIKAGPGVDPKGYIYDADLIKKLRKELRSKKIETPMGILTYEQFLKTAVILERQRVTFSEYMLALQIARDLGKGNRDAAKSYLNHVILSHPELLDDPEVIGGEAQEEMSGMFDLIDIGMQHSNANKELMRKAKNELLDKILEIGVEDYKRNKPTTVGDIASGEGLTSKQENERQYRLFESGEIELTDFGPITQALKYLERLKLPIFDEKISGSELRRRLDEFDTKFMGHLKTLDFRGRYIEDESLHGIIVNYYFGITEKGLDLLSRRVLDGEDSIKTLLGINFTPKGVTEDPDTVVKYLSERAKQYTGKIPVLFRPFDFEIESMRFRGYAPSDLVLDRKNNLATLTSQLLSSGAYPLIKIGALIEHFSESMDLPETEGYNSLEQIAQKLNSNAKSVKRLFESERLKPKSLVLLNTSLEMLKDPLAVSFADYTTLEAFYQMKFVGRNPEKRDKVEGMVRYDSSQIDATLKNVLITASEAGKILFDIDISLDPLILNEVLKNERLRNTMMPLHFTSGGQEVYYNKDVQRLREEMRRDANNGTKLYLAHMYHMLKNSLSPKVQNE